MSILFIGNGINRKEKISVSWTELLSKICEELHCGISNDYIATDIGQIYGNTMQYEYLDSFTQETGSKLKKRIAEMIGPTGQRICDKADSIHKSIMTMPVDCIFTTNYDYSLEYSVNPEFKPQRSTTERDYSFRRYQESGGKRVYHIHGECKYPSSILLGYEHYAGALEKMRGTIVQSTKAFKGGEHQFHLYDVINGLEPVGEEWYYKMFMEDIYFLGFGFDPSEEDIWWLLSYRKRLLREKKLQLNNKIVFLNVQPADKQQSRESIALKTLLQSFGVEIVSFESKDRDENYKKALEYLNDKIQ